VEKAPGFLADPILSEAVAVEDELEVIGIGEVETANRP